MSDIRLHESIEIDRPADEVWRVVADYARDPEWRGGVVSMTPVPPGPAGPGTTTAEVMRFAGRTLRNDGEVTGTGPGLAFTWRTVRGAHAHGSRAVTPVGSGCRVDMTLVVTPRPSELLLRPVAARLLRRGLRDDLLRLARLCDRAARPSSPDGALPVV